MFAIKGDSSRAIRQKLQSVFKCGGTEQVEDKRVDGSRRTVSENPVLEKWERRSKGLRGPQRCVWPFLDA